MRLFAGAYYVDSPLTLLMLAGGGVATLGKAIVMLRSARAGAGGRYQSSRTA
ncbi:hypothetical protein [Sphingomonas faeni]|uniref:hypothetical protein n=1 Tax=Sphingomonas faeni TaxID=185950 RepID=UPI0020BFCFEA|nr:hypothetical protein [Sphingomonas faeni]MCK8455762.1 hypothetical protein [Sphingomonas faeni]